VKGSELTNDGSDFGDANWVDHLWNAHWVAAPEQVPADARAYSVSAEIRILDRPQCGSFGLVADGAYQAGVHLCSDYAQPVVSIRSARPEVILVAPFNPDGDWHQYRMEVSRYTVRLFVDGVQHARVRQQTDGEPGAAGMWSDHTNIAVRAFFVEEL